MGKMMMIMGMGVTRGPPWQACDNKHSGLPGSLHTAQCTLHTAHCTFHTSHCKFYILYKPGQGLNIIPELVLYSVHCNVHCTETQIIKSQDGTEIVQFFCVLCCTERMGSWEHRWLDHWSCHHPLLLTEGGQPVRKLSFKHLLSTNTFEGVSY